MVTPPNCTDCVVSSAIFSHNSSTHQRVTSFYFGPSPWLLDLATAARLGFEFSYQTGFRNWCPGNPYLLPQFSCVDAPAYCGSTSPYAGLTRTDARHYTAGDMLLRIPPNVAGVRFKVQRTVYANAGPPSTVRLNGVTLWSAPNCVSTCPHVVSTAVSAGDVLDFRAEDDTLAIFWLELWEHTRWPTQLVPMSGDVGAVGRLWCTRCPANHSTPTCLPSHPSIPAIPPTAVIPLPVPNAAIAAGDNYTVVLGANGTAPHVWALQTRAVGLSLSGTTLTWTLPQCSAVPHPIVASVFNSVGGVNLSWSLTVRCGYAVTTAAVTPAVVSVPGVATLSGRTIPSNESVVCGIRNPVRLQVASSATGGLSTVVDTGPDCRWVYRMFVYSAGEYSVSAAHPNDPAPAVQRRFVGLGLQFAATARTLRVGPAQFNQTSVFVGVNPGPEPLANLSVRLHGGEGSPVGMLGWGLALNVSAVAVGEAVGVALQWAGATPGRMRLGVVLEAWFNGTVISTTLSLEVVVAVPVLPAARIVPFPNPLVGQAVLGRQSFFTVNLTNVGGTAATNLSVALPPDGLLAVVAPAGLITLPPRGTVTLTLVATPNASMPQSIYRGGFSVGSADLGTHAGTSGLGQTRVGVALTLVTGRSSNLTVVLQDERTFLGTASTNWTGAPVTIVSQLTRRSTTVLANSSGYAVFPHVPDAVYSVRGQALHHSAVTRVVSVGARTGTLALFLAYSVISYTWTVVPVLLRDSYRFTLDITYETRVPAPVVVVQPAVLDVDALLRSRPATLQFTLTNLGLITADDLQFFVPGSLPGMTLTPVVGLPATLGANVSLLYPVRIGYTNASATRRRRSAVGCPDPLLMFTYQCGGTRPGRGSPVQTVGAEACDGGSPDGSSSGGFLSGGGGGFVPWGGRVSPAAGGGGGYTGGVYSYTPSPGNDGSGFVPYGRFDPGPGGSISESVPCAGPDPATGGNPGNNNFNPCGPINQIGSCLQAAGGAMGMAGRHGADCAANLITTGCNPSAQAAASTFASCGAAVGMAVNPIAACPLAVLQTPICMDSAFGNLARGQVLELLHCVATPILSCTGFGAVATAAGVALNGWVPGFDFPCWACTCRVFTSMARVASHVCLRPVFPLASLSFSPLPVSVCAYPARPLPTHPPPPLKKKPPAPCTDTAATAHNVVPRKQVSVLRIVQQPQPQPARAASAAGRAAAPRAPPAERSRRDRRLFPHRNHGRKLRRDAGQRDGPRAAARGVGEFAVGGDLCRGLVAVIARGCLSHPARGLDPPCVAPEQLGGEPHDCRGVPRLLQRLPKRLDRRKHVGLALGGLLQLFGAR